ncbi:hypothetical protein [Flavobacterium sp. N2038]|uniref:hypothetical protein n=1 Tax=Flavobacterium sp. N2038 TaxID=2986829 RepID=UPI0022251166|nr:hypothetical protein [Flavobacterium sp. N2038]
MYITLISLDNWGLNKHIASSLEKQGHVVHHIDFNTFKYKYPSVLHKANNFILKAFFKTNLKHLHYGKEIINQLQKNNQIQDVILTIKGDFIDPKSILEFKNYTKKSVGFFNDNTYRCPKIKRVLHCFDEVFSFEKEDCAKFNLKFASNWIYTSKSAENNNQFDFDVFNISSIDKRLPILKRIANNLASQNINFKFIIYDKKKNDEDKNITYIRKHMPLSEVNDYISRSKVLLDINRLGQAGLTFRVFESLGLEKKLITTNSDIKNYDFYNPNNILIIDENNPVVPADFFKNEYEKIPDSILHKYTLEGWTEIVVLK